MKWPSRVHWVDLQALHWLPSVHSAPMLGHARNVHTYGYKHKHLGMAWKLVAGYLTFLTWKTLAKFGDGCLPEKSQHCFFCSNALNDLCWSLLRRTSCGCVNYNCCLSEAKVEAVWCCWSCVKHPSELVSLDVCVTLIPAPAFCILFIHSCELCSI